MASPAPTFTRCTLSISHLADIEVIPIPYNGDRTKLHIVIHLTQGRDIWQADEAISSGRVPGSSGLRPLVRVPDARRLIFEATISAGAHRPVQVLPLSLPP